MYTLELTLWERLQLDLSLPRNAPLTEIKQLLRIMDTVAPTEEEKKAVDFALSDVMSSGGMVTVPVWDTVKMDAMVGETPVKLESEDFRILQKCAKDRSSWPLALRTVDLQEKLDQSQEDS